jgi:hypothetical protein
MKFIINLLEIIGNFFEFIQHNKFTNANVLIRVFLAQNCEKEMIAIAVGGFLLLLIVLDAFFFHFVCLFVECARFLRFYFTCSWKAEFLFFNSIFAYEMRSESNKRIGRYLSDSYATHLYLSGEREMMRQLAFLISAK